MTDAELRQEAYEWRDRDISACLHRKGVLACECVECAYLAGAAAERVRAVAVVEGHRCYTEEPEGCVSLDAHPGQTCAAAIAARLRGGVL